MIVHFDDEIMRVFQTIGIRNKLSKKLIINKGTKFLDEKEKLILDWPRPKKMDDMVGILVIGFINLT